MKRKRTPARMARLVAQWRESGASQAGFARQHRIPTWTFWYWCRKLSAAASAPDPSPTVAVRPGARGAGAGRARDRDRVQRWGALQVRPGASADLVRAVVAALRATC